MQTLVEDATNFQILLTEAVRSITQRSIHLVKADPQRFMHMHELLFPEYIPGLVLDLRTPAFADALSAAKSLFGVNGQAVNQKQLRSMRILFRQCIAKNAATNHWPAPINDHAWRVGRNAVAVGKELGLPRSELCDLFWGGWLHDVGKLFIFELAEVLESQGVDYRMILPLVRTHASLGGLFLESVAPLFEVGMICASQHQENVDGTGYPNGLRYEQLSLAGRIVNMSDCYDATVTRKAWRATQVGEELRQIYTRAGHPNDAALLAFLRVVERYHTHWYL